MLSFRRVGAGVGGGEYCSINTLRKLIIYHVFGCCAFEELDRVWGIVEPLDIDTCYTLYYKVMKIVDIAGTLETYESVQQLLRQSLTELLTMRWIAYRKIRKEEEAELAELVLHQHPRRFFSFPSFDFFPSSFSFFSSFLGTSIGLSHLEIQGCQPPHTSAGCCT